MRRSPSRARRPAAAPVGVALALLLAGAPVAALADPVAVIAAIQGRVEVTSARGGAARRATVGHTLERGDRVRVAAGGSATLFFNDGNILELAERGSLRIGGPPAARAGAAGSLPGEVYASVTKFVAGGSRETGLVAESPLRSGPADGDVPLLLAPRRTVVATDRPAFTWRAAAGATRYRVTLSSPAAGELWTREVTGTSLPYPAEAPPLDRAAEYLWQVEALSDVKRLRREDSVFEVASERLARSVEANLIRIRESAGGADHPAARFLAGSYLSGLELFGDAIAEFDAMRERAPASPAPHEALGAIYARIGLTDLAAAAYQRALALSREP